MPGGKARVGVFDGRGATKRVEVGVVVSVGDGVGDGLVVDAERVGVVSGKIGVPNAMFDEESVGRRGSFKKPNEPTTTIAMQTIAAQPMPT